MKALVILSTGAGKGTHAEAGQAISREFTAAGIDFEILTASAKDKPDEMVRRRLNDGFDLVVAGGGDGTVAAIFDALHGTSIPLAIIPIGTGNMVAREFEIPTSVDDALALITGSAHTKKIDAMRIGGRVYVLSAGIGINAAVVARTTRKNKERFGRLAYAATILKLFHFRPRAVDITIDGDDHRYRAVEVAVSNCGGLARAVYPSGPDIRADDGHLDVWILSMQTFPEYARYLLGILFGRRTEAQFFTAKKKVTIRTGFPMAAQADGDLIGTTPLEIDLLPAALTLVVPEEKPA